MTENTLYSLECIVNTKTGEVEEEISDVYNILENDAEEILEIFEKAIELKWFKI